MESVWEGRDVERLDMERVKMWRDWVWREKECAEIGWRE